MHSYGKFLSPDKDILEYMDRFNVEKAIVTTVNRAKFFSKENKDQMKRMFESKNTSDILESLKKLC